MLLVGRQEGHLACKKIRGDGGAGQWLPYFPDYKLLFFQKFQGSGLYSKAYIAVRLMCGRFQETTAHYGVPQSALDHDQLTHSTPQSLTVSAAVWPPLPRPPCLSVSVCVCVVSHSSGSQLHCSTWRPSTARSGRARENSHLKARAEHAALAPRWQ